MSENLSKCISPLLQTIINKLDPIILHGYASNETPSPTETPEPTSSPQTNVDIDDCIDKAVEGLKHSLSSTYPYLSGYEEFVKLVDKEPSISLTSLPEEIDEWYRNSILSVAKENINNPWLADLDDLFGLEGLKIFRPGRTTNSRPLIIPGVGEFHEYEYQSGWDARDSYQILNLIRYGLLTQIENVYCIRALLSIRKYSSTKEKIDKVISSANYIISNVKQFETWRKTLNSNTLSSIPSDTKDNMFVKWQGLLFNISPLFNVSTVHSNLIIDPMNTLLACVTK